MKIKAFMIPKNHEYINRLKSSLEKIDVEVKILKPFHYSSLMNIVKILLYRIKGYKIIHVHWLYVFPFSFVMKSFYYFCKCLSIKVIWEMHNILPHGYNARDRKNSRWFYERSEAVIFHSNEDINRSKEILETDIDKRNILIPHGNFNGSFPNNISKKEARKILDIPDTKKAILCFGSIRRNRGYEYLIEATKDMKDIVVLVVGKIQAKDTHQKLLDYERKISNLKLFTGWIPDEKLQIYFNASDIVVLPYTEITTSGVIPLAYAFSRPIIATAIGGIKDVVNENTGVLVPPKEVDTLRKAIEKLLSIDFEAMGKFAYEYSKVNFGWELIAKKIKKLYEVVL